jgi:Zn-dependent protease/predicted transcriptional regulator
MKYAVRLAKVSGIRIEVHWTFLLLIAWVVFSNARRNVASQEIVWSVILVLAVFVCVILHELGHALAAKKFNIKTTRITLLPIGGLAQMEQIPEKPKEELIIAFAGPAVNLVIAAILYPITGISSSTLSEIDPAVKPENFLLILMTLNLWLALFNLIPAFPMDGGRVLRALLSFQLGHVKATRIAATVGQLLGICFVFFGLFYNPFLTLIGIFIYLGAGSESTYTQTKSLLRGYTAKDVVMHDVPFIDKNAPLKEAVHQLLDSQNKNFVVRDGTKPVGTLSRKEIIKALHEHDGDIPVDQIKNDLLVYFPLETPLENIWREMQKQRSQIILVGNDGNLEGIVDDENLAEFILIHSEQDAPATKYLDN